jgi:phosphopantothenoylcysteine decarboxylase/phosphopantothenate--cysteine ligase
MILLGVSGSIAAYKAVDLLRLLLKGGQDVQVVMTEAATHFVGPLTFQALSGHPVLTNTLDPQGWQMAHLDLPEKAAAYVIAPASAHTLSQLAQGGAGDILTASALAIPRTPAGKLKIPVYVAPAMHEAMWLHPATQTNVKTLKQYGYEFLGPERGELGRTGDVGHGRMVEPQKIAEVVLKSLGKSSSK